MPSSTLFRLAGALAVTAALAGLAHADIRYKVAPNEAGDRIVVDMEFDTDQSEVDLQMPSWQPGAYALANYWSRVAHFTAVDTNGATLSVTQPRQDTWRVATPGGGTVRVRYDVPTGGGFGPQRPAAGGSKTIHYGGPSTYCYVVGRKNERCVLEVNSPKVAIGTRESRGEVPTFRFKNYDILADNPVTLGEFVEGKYVEAGKEHILAVRGAAASSLDMTRAIRLCQFVTKIQADFFGGLPFDKYVWHFAVIPDRDGGGGLEHLSSTQISLGGALGPRALALLSHEYFHLWNVKRIRSRALGPFDYTQLPKTGALWWLEGVTDYYAHLLPYRYGAYTREQFLRMTSEQITSVRSNPRRMQVSAFDSSYKVGDGSARFSSGFGVDYYSTGYTLGLLLDIELRARTRGAHSLDEVERTLWKMCRDDDRPGFEEDEIRKQLIRIGGPEMGAVYDKWVLQPGDLPIEAILGKAGLRVSSKTEGSRTVYTISERADATPDEVMIREGLLQARADAHILDGAPAR